MGVLSKSIKENNTNRTVKKTEKNEIINIKCDSANGQGNELQISWNKENKGEIWKLTIWNIIGFNGKVVELAKEISKKDIDIIGVTETRQKWYGTVITGNGYMMIYSSVKTLHRVRVVVDVFNITEILKKFRNCCIL